MLDDQEFKLKADASLQRLYRALAELSDAYDFEPDLAGALTVEFEEPPAKFVVSPNSPVKQIWVSAHSRSYKLDYDRVQDEFVLAETGQTLPQLIADAISRQIDEEITL